jgi:hypothetical protein
MYMILHLSWPFDASTNKISGRRLSLACPPLIFGPNLFAGAQETESIATETEI